MDRKIRRRINRCAMVLLAAGVLGTGVAIAEDMWVSAATVKVLDDPSAFGSEIATLKQGDKIVVLEHLADGWLKVQVGDKVGYVFKDALSAQQVGGDTFADARDSSASASAGAAAKGFTPEEYAQAKGMDEKFLKDMEAATKASINKQTMTAFMTEGNVGPKHNVQ